LFTPGFIIVAMTQKRLHAEGQFCGPLYKILDCTLYDKET